MTDYEIWKMLEEAHIYACRRVAIVAAIVVVVSAVWVILNQ